MSGVSRSMFGFNLVWGPRMFSGVVVDIKFRCLQNTSPRQEFIWEPKWSAFYSAYNSSGRLKVEWGAWSGLKDSRRKFRSQTSDNMERWKAEQGRGREKRKIRRKKSRRERVRRKRMQMRERVGKLRNTVFFQWFGAPEGRKVGSLKQGVRSHLAKWEMKNCTPLWRELHFQVKMYKTYHSRTTFGSWDVEKVHAVVARSTFWSQNVQPGSDHFWKFRCRKSARRCGAKHISKPKCTKHTRFGPLLEVRMLKKWTRLWREAHFQVKMYKTPYVRATFGSWDVEKVHAVCGAKHICKSKCTKHQMFGPLLEVRMLKKWTRLWREAHFQVKMYKAPYVRATFGGSDVEKVHAVLASKCTKH